MMDNKYTFIYEDERGMKIEKSFKNIVQLDDIQREFNNFLKDIGFFPEEGDSWDD